MKKTVIAFMFLAGIMFLSACGSTYEIPEPKAISIVLGNHANSFALNLNTPDMVSSVANATANGYISVINCDGKPALVSADIYTIPEQYLGADPKKLESDARQKAAKLLAGLAGVKAQQVELDTLKALWQAVGSFDAVPDIPHREIIVIDTGLSTTDVLDFRNNLLGADPDTIAELLVERDAIPVLSGITVKWHQLGDVAPPQPALSYRQLHQLKSIWTAIIEKRGGTVVFSDMVSAQQANDPGDYPEISIVKLPPETSLSFDPVKVTVFDERQVCFIGDTAEYVDPTAVQVALRPAAEFIMAHPEFTALLIGTTASGNRTRCLKLSEDRAGAVRETLVSIGVPGEQLLTLGLGFEDPWHIPDTDSGGRLVEKLASQNRKVLLMDADSPTAREIISSA